jgi:hypothetical protein
MTDAKDGGPVFPCKAETGNGRRIEHHGMSLRDYAAVHAEANAADFADLSQASAFAGMPEPDHNDLDAVMKVSAAAIAKARYMLADAMLAARGARHD